MLFTLVLSALGVVVRTESNEKGGPFGWLSTDNWSPSNRFSTKDISPEQVGLTPAELKAMRSESAEQKRENLWGKVVGNSTSGEFRSLGAEAISKFIRTDYLWQTQNTYSDEMPVNHKKFIHPVGRVGKAKFNWNDAAKKYTGLFQKADKCMVRFSSAAKPYPLLPGMGLKCLRDGVPSGNFVAMWQLDGLTKQPASMADRAKTCKFFSVPFSNHVAIRKDLSQAVKIPAHITFARVSTEPGWRLSRLWESGAPNLVGLSSFASAGQDGNVVAPEDVNFPFALFFAPTKAVTALACSEETADGLDQVAGIVAGMDIYDVYAVHDPAADDEQTGNIEKIGTLSAESAFTTSKFGDDRLFIRHDFYGKDVEAMEKADPARGKKFRAIWTDNDFMKTEGAIKYEKPIEDLAEEDHFLNGVD